MSKTIKVTIALILIGAAYGFGRYLQPAKIETKIKIKTETIEVEVEKIRTEVRTIIKETKKPDGTLITETTTENINENENKNVSKNEQETIKHKIVENFKPQWKVQGQVSLNNGINGESTFRVGVERRVIGPVFAGAWADTNLASYGLSVSMEF